MKIKALLGVMATLALVACTENKIEPQLSEVGFKAVARRNTKGIITGSAFPTKESFQVWGFYTQAGDYFELENTAVPNFMKGVEISYLTTESKWRNADKHYYWPNRGKVGFYALYPKDLNPTLTFGGGILLSDYAITSLNDTVDLMYAYNEGPESTIADALPMVFNHALAQLEFKIKTDATYDDAAITVNSILLKKVDTAATFKYRQSGETDNQNQASATWEDIEQSADYTYHQADSVAESTEKVYGKAIVFIPQNGKNGGSSEVDDSKTHAAVNFTFTQSDTDPIEYTLLVDLDPSKKAGQSTNWEMGKRYVYTLNFKLNEILFNPSVKNWVEVTYDAVDVDRI